MGVEEAAFQRRFAFHSSVGRASGQPSDGSSLHVNRYKLECFLREGLDIRWDHTLKDIRASPKGIILAFDNGIFVESPCVVGADGMHSQLRKSILPNQRSSTLPFVVFDGKCRISRPEFQRYFASHMDDGHTLQTIHKNRLLSISVTGVWNDSVGLRYTYSRPARSRRSHDPLHKPIRARTVTAEIPWQFFVELEALKPLQPPFIGTFNPTRIQSKGDDLKHWLLRRVTLNLADAKRLSESGVVLMGDAAHASPVVLGGQDANLTITDAVVLSEIVATQHPQHPIAFFHQRHDRWNHSAESFKRSLATMHQSGGAAV